MISLQVTDLLNTAAENIDLVVTQLVVEELKEIKQHNDQIGQAAEKILYVVVSKDIEIFNIPENDVKELQTSNIDEGEASCFILAKNKNIKFLVMDDIKASSTLESLAIKENIHQRISVAVIIGLMNMDVISKEKAKRSVDLMVKDREWKGSVLEVLVEKYLNED
ncbi:MAG: hypothetical protein ACQESD_06470 [Thermoplasmatota archaeon]